MEELLKSPQLAIALTNATLDLPETLRTVATMLSGVQLLLANLLVQRVPYIAAVVFMDDLYKNIHGILEREMPKHERQSLQGVKH